MGSVPLLLRFLLDVVSGWVQRRQLLVVEFLQAENRMLNDRLRGKRIRFTDAERALLARKAKAVGRKALMELDTIVSPDTLMRWHRRLVAQKWYYSHRRGPGRPGIMREISQLIVRMAVDNPGWGYTRIQGALANVDHKVGRGTIENVLPPLSPNLNAFAERFVRSNKEECLTKRFFVGQGSMRRALTECMTHFHEERNHRGLGNRLIRGYSSVAANDGSIHRRARVGGMLSDYHRVAA